MPIKKLMGKAALDNPVQVKDGIRIKRSKKAQGRTDWDLAAFFESVFWMS
jgi:hypothetical protein